MSMSFPSSRTNQELKEHDEEESNQNLYQHYQELVSAIPSVEACSSVRLHLHDGWYSTIPVFVSSMVAQRLFQAKQDDILLATLPKSGTTWLKALLFATANRGKYTNSSHPLATLNPHECVPFLENQLYMNNQIPDLDSVPTGPRLFATHAPFHSLPKSVVNSGCRIVYLCRDPKDNFVSLWHFINKIRASGGAEHLPLEAAFDRFCNGISAFGPYWDHVLGYWNATLRRECAGKILFVRYEEFMEEPVSELKRLAEFIGCPLTLDEAEAEADGILELCGFDNLSNLQVNKVDSTKMVYGVLENRTLFRRGAVGGTGGTILRRRWFDD